MKKKKNGQPIPAPQYHLSPEWLRTEDVRRVFGIRRGSLYGLAALGKVKSSLLRIRGNRLGVRVWQANSIRSFIEGQSGGGRA